MKIVTNVKKLKLVIWKNYIVNKRHWTLTISQLCFPILLILVLVIVKPKLSDTNKVHHDVTTYRETFIPDTSNISRLLHIYYTPLSQLSRRLITKVKKILNLSKKRVHGFTNMHILTEKYMEDIAKNEEQLSLVIQFHNDLYSGDHPTNLKYSISCTEFNTMTELLLEPSTVMNPSENAGQLYFTQHFLNVQGALDISFIQIASGTLSRTGIPVQVSLQRFPYPNYIGDNSLNTIYMLVLPMIICYGFIPIFITLIKHIIEEEASGINNLVELMGLQWWMIWIGRLLNVLVINILAITVCVILLKCETNIDLYSDGFLLWIYLVIQNIAETSFVAFLTILFDNSKKAIPYGLFLILTTYAVPQILTQYYPELRLIFKLLLSFIFPNATLVFGFENIGTFEMKAKGLHWIDLFSKPNANPNSISMGVICITLFVNIVLYASIIYFVGNIRPDSNGVRKSCCFTRKNILKCFKTSVEPEADVITTHSWNYEEPSLRMESVIEIRNLRKVFEGKVAIDDLTMDIYKGFITVLLGHKRAGKSTMVSILTGMFPPTSGDVRIYGFSIQNDLEEAHFVGLCPQQNILFPDLNVIEHLIFFSKLGGSSHGEALKDAYNTLKLLDITYASKNLSKTLSGGMKRKLALAIALTGNADVLVLDEPTFGMNSETRREVWNLLITLRRTRTIIITTHSMEEAEVLGDRIAIMEDGNLLCYGSLHFLKQKYGAGYQLSLISRGKADEQKIVSVIQKYVPNVVPQRWIGDLFVYTLPTDHRSKFPKLFEDLETNKASLSIEKIKLSIITMKDVFRRMNQKLLEMNRSEESNLSNGISLPLSKVAGFRLQRTRLKALLIKKLLYSSRILTNYIVVILLPILWLVLVFFAPSHISRATSPPLILNLNAYGKTEIIYSTDLNMASQISEHYINETTESKFRKVNALDEEVLSIGNASIAQYLDKLIVGANFINFGPNTVKVRGKYSSHAIHAAPISLNMLSNAVLRYLTNNSSYSITVINQPFKKKYNVLLDTDSRSITFVVLWVLESLLLLNVLSIFIVYPLSEKNCQVKQLQIMAGTSLPLYWFSCFVIDMLFICVMCFSISLMIYNCDDKNYFLSVNEYGVFCLMFVMFGVSGTLYAYTSFGKSVTESVHFFSKVNLIIGCVSVGLLFSTYFYEVPYFDIANIILSLNPSYAFCLAQAKFALIISGNSRCRFISATLLDIVCNNSLSENSVCCGKSCSEQCEFDQQIAPGFVRKLFNESRPVDNSWSTFLDWEIGIGPHLLMLAVDVVIYVVILSLIECNVCSYIISSIHKKQPRLRHIDSRIDENVLKERLHIAVSMEHRQRDLPGLEYILLVDDLEKVYNGKFHAVRGVSFGVNAGECFGLLGHKQAGKTTTIQMLTGSERPTSGDAMFGPYKLSKNKKAYMLNIGYCPQSDGLNEVLTARETLTLFGRLRGIAPSHLSDCVNIWLNEMGLNKNCDVRCGKYSTGNKRKLSVAVALIGNPPLVFLDEPTSGVDILSRTKLCNIFRKIITEGQSIVLSSHSIEECEALCERLAIMVKGQLVCFGPVQYLKQRFGQGFTLLVQINQNMREFHIVRLKEKILEEFPTAVLKDEHDGLLHYFIADRSTKWSKLFQGMENIVKADTSGMIEDYTISETTLEQIFLYVEQINND